MKTPLRASRRPASPPVVTMMDIRSPDFSRLKTESVYLWTKSPPFPSSPATTILLCVCVLGRFLFVWGFLDPTEKRDRAVFVFPWLISLSTMPSRAVRVVASGRISFFFPGIEYSVGCTYILRLTRSSFRGPLSCFCVLATVSDAARSP